MILQSNAWKNSEYSYKTNLLVRGGSCTRLAVLLWFVFDAQKRNSITSQLQEQLTSRSFVLSLPISAITVTSCQLYDHMCKPTCALVHAETKYWKPPSFEHTLRFLATPPLCRDTVRAGGGARGWENTVTQRPPLNHTDRLISAKHHQRRQQLSNTSTRTYHAFMTPQWRFDTNFRT